MLRVEATLRTDKEIPFSIMGSDVGRVILKATTYHAGLNGDVAAREVNLTGYQLVTGFVCFLGATQLLLWVILKLWLFEP